MLLSVEPQPTANRPVLGVSAAALMPVSSMLRSVGDSRLPGFRWVSPEDGK
jgi:hypothetical protein